MKPFILLIAGLFTGLLANAQCSELFISEYVEGTGNDKALEIYNPTANAINLSGYRIERFSNGSSSSSAGGVLNLSGTVAAHDVFVIVNGQTVDVVSPPSPKCSPALQALADQLDGPYPAPMYMNGNDAIVLYNNTTIADIFGKTGDAGMVSGYGWSDQPPYDGSAGAIWTENHTLVRKASVTSGVTANPSTFIVTVEWDSLPKDTWTGLGQHSSNCFVGINEIGKDVSVAIYPNPVDNGYFNIASSETIKTVEVYNFVGKKIISKTGDKKDKKMTIAIDELAKGIYVVKVSFESRMISVIKLTVN